MKYKIEYVDNVPEILKEETVYILGGRKHPSQVILLCPKIGKEKCKRHIYLHLSDQTKQRWKLVENEDGIISVNPSIFIKCDKKCHFYLKNGEILWV